jgi:hypothetical protein
MEMITIEQFLTKFKKNESDITAVDVLFDAFTVDT